MKLYKGDCLEQHKHIKDGSVDLILTDLPYGTVKGLGNSESINHGMKGKTEWDSVIDINKIMEIANRILRKNGKMILTAQQPFTNELINKALPNLPFNYSMIWEKDHFANALTAKKAPLNYYEDVLVFSKGSHGTYGEDDSYREYLNIERKKAKLTLDEMCGVCGLNTKGHGGAAYHWCSSLQPSMIPEKHYLKLREVTGFFNREYQELKEIHFNCFKRFASTFNLWEGKKYKSNILKYKKDYDGYHPTQKPVLLLEDLMKTFSNENDSVVDLTMGSGTTGVACKNLNRDFIGIEIDKDYFEIAKKRIEKHTTQQRLF
ncbi:site-specific DNA-methyltransferase [archaeon]|jgi:site-specific DNA-methyltransferase (adenine-specific)|nr:site-specific DNA-methyltransferase [archaeon]MBT4732281.1 site-specific DNA-methyltransferase [Candidatus Woesearchaeota archaeon]MBT7555344.1 site-specific DNA-methyltransferase [Candidatus Woesearchaeota archaeon]